MSANEMLDPNAIRAGLAKSIHDHWVLYFVEAIVLLALGMIAIIVPPLATLGVTLVIGWVFLAGGIVGLIATFRARHAPGFWWSLVSAVLGIAAGLLLLAWPLSGAVSLTLVLISFFIVEGIATIMFGVEQRHHISTWGWMVASGIVDVLLAGILFAGFPETAAWALGLLVGIDMIFGGAALAVISLDARTARVTDGANTPETTAGAKPHA